MIKKNRFNYLKVIIISSIILIVFIIISNIVQREIENYLYKINEENDVKITHTYINELEKTFNANYVIDYLIREKIIVASNVLELERKDLININLKKISDFLEIDRIYYYNLAGELIESTTNEKIGWKAPKDHPVYNFINSKKIFMIEDEIRRDTYDQKYFKYGYYYLPEKGYIQIGINSDRIEKYLDAFETEKILNKMTDLNSINKTVFIKKPKQFNSNLYSNKKTKINDQYIEEIINRKESCIRRYNEDKNAYRIYMPVKFSNNIEGVLFTEFNLKEVKNTTKNLKITVNLFMIFLYILIVYTLITKEKSQYKIKSLAYYDKLTNFPNVNYFMDNYSETISKVKAVFVLKFVSLETINMTYGYNYGSEILKKIANRLDEYSFDKEIEIFKTKDDEFVISWETHKTKRQLIKAVKEINRLFTQKFEIQEAKIYLKFKIAVIDLKNSTLELSDVLKKSNIILKSLSNKKHKNYAFYDKLAEEKLKRHENIQSELRSIIDNNNEKKRIYLNYQPFIDTKNDEIVGFEALARFNSENYGNVSPGEFISIAEKQGLIIQLTKIIFDQAFNLIRKLKVNNYKDLKIAVNISSIHLLSEDFEKDLDKLDIKDSIFNNLEIEITESVFLDNFELINDKLEQLQKKGIKVSLDDFGTGYSSFSRFTELNIDYLKIDKYFVDKILDEKKGGLITKKIISMAHSLDIKVIAEGVEEKEQEKYLKKNNCDILQGYLYSKPVKEEEVFKLLQQN